VRRRRARAFRRRCATPLRRRPAAAAAADAGTLGDDHRHRQGDAQKRRRPEEPGTKNRSNDGPRHTPPTSVHTIRADDSVHRRPPFHSTSPPFRRSNDSVLVLASAATAELDCLLGACASLTSGRTAPNEAEARASPHAAPEGLGVLRDSDTRTALWRQANPSCCAARLRPLGPVPGSAPMGLRSGLLRPPSPPAYRGRGVAHPESSLIRPVSKAPAPITKDVHPMNDHIGKKSPRIRSDSATDGRGSPTGGSEKEPPGREGSVGGPGSRRVVTGSRRRRRGIEPLVAGIPTTDALSELAGEGPRLSWHGSHLRRRGKRGSCTGSGVADPGNSLVVRGSEAAVKGKEVAGFWKDLQLAWRGPRTTSRRHPPRGRPQAEPIQRFLRQRTELLRTGSGWSR
jgi:hypothetical protein